MASVLHDSGSADFSNYQYTQIYVGSTATILGNSVTGPIVLDIGITKAGSVSGDFLLLGKKKPEKNTSLNSDGTLSIKG